MKQAGCSETYVGADVSSLISGAVVFSSLHSAANDTLQQFKHTTNTQKESKNRKHTTL